MTLYGQLVADNSINGIIIIFSDSIKIIYLRVIINIDNYAHKKCNFQFLSDSVNADELKLLMIS